MYTQLFTPLASAFRSPSPNSASFERPSNVSTGQTLAQTPDSVTIRFGQQQKNYKLQGYKEVTVSRGNVDDTAIHPKHKNPDIDASITKGPDGSKTLSVTGKATADYLDGYDIDDNRVFPGEYKFSYTMTFTRTAAGEFGTLHYSTKTEEMRAYLRDKPDSEYEASFTVKALEPGKFVLSSSVGDLKDPLEKPFVNTDIVFDGEPTITAETKTFKKPGSNDVHQGIEQVTTYERYIPEHRTTAKLKITTLNLQDGPDKDREMITAVDVVVPDPNDRQGMTIGTDSHLDLPVDMEAALTK